MLFHHKLSQFAMFNEGTHPTVILKSYQKRRNIHEKNMAGYTVHDAPSTRLKITRDGRNYGPRDTLSFRDATAHLKSIRDNMYVKVNV